ncbi:MAG: hypothetical protein KatS3mg028_0343 [Bacteroidia bacterium]|nr:MAG: hypothetical protein KatS3mg028_0343 [Bacteroidia bacterium]
MDKKHALIWAGWYPQNENDYSGIFIKKHIEIIANHLNVNIHVFSIKHQKHLWWYKKIIIKESFGNVHYWYIPAFFPLKLVGYFIIPFIEARRLQKKAKHIDYFHLHVSYPYAVFTFLLRFLKIDNWLLTEHWSGYTKYDNSFVKLNKLMQKGIAMVLKRMNKISVVSNFLNKELIGRFPFLANKIAITYNVINFPKKKHSIEIKDIFCLLTISSLKNNPKNLSFLLRVMAEVVKEYSAIKLDIYGDGQDKQTLVQLADELGLLNHHVFFKGKFNNAEVEKIYSHYHAFILLSKFETFSIVTAEALAHGLPVIVTKCGAPEEYVMNELNGYLVEINNLEQTKSAVFSLIRNYSKFDATTIQNTVKE